MPGTGGKGKRPAVGTGPVTGLRTPSTPPEKAAGTRRPLRGRGGLPYVLAALPMMLLILGFLVLLWISPGLRGELVTAWDLLVHGDPEPLTDWLLQFGVWAPMVSALLQIATSIFPPLPSFLVAIANAMVYGVVLGGLLTFVTALAAAAVCFGIARLIGRPGVVRIISVESLEKMDGFMERRGLLAVFLARLIPFINPDVVSYAAGVTGIRWLPFLLAIAAGSVPATVFYSVVGAAAIESTPWVVGMVVASTFVPIILLVIFRKKLPLS
jgi:uncharacterized membrane protein YdjX (TVP38/TMEM64 family)